MNRKASPEILNRLAINLKARRHARGFTQKELGELCGLTKNYISNVEQATENISLASLEALANGLGCTERELVARLPLSSSKSEVES